MMNDETAGEDAQSQVHARCMGGMSQVQAKRKAVTWEVRARYMRGTSQGKASGHGAGAGNWWGAVSPPGD